MQNIKISIYIRKDCKMKLGDIFRWYQKAESAQ